MRNALYYPHTQIRDDRFLRTSLLLWDTVSFVAPFKGYQFSGSPRDEIEALELLCRSHVPTEKERNTVHKRVVALLNKPIPEWLATERAPLLDNVGHGTGPIDDEYQMYAQKLDMRTWKLLEAAGLVKQSERGYRHQAAKPMMGFFLMSLLADACAESNQLRKITDRTDAYGFLWKMRAAELVDPPQDADFGANSAARTGLVSIALRTLNAERVPLKNILEMRQREAKAGGHHYRLFRENFAEKIEENALKAVAASSLEERRSIAFDFERKMRDDLAFLRDELGAAKRDLFLSKETVGLVSAGAIFGQTWTVLAGLGAGIVTSVAKFSGAHRAALAKHPMSYLYLGRRPTLSNVPFGSLGFRGHRG
ncbi:MAG: hypothetical protein V4505_04975 [Pseudomonadota bacterium]